MIHHKLSREKKVTVSERIGQKRRQSFNPRTAVYDNTGVSTTPAKKEDSYVHDYQSLPSDVLQAIKSMYQIFRKMNY